MGRHRITIWTVALMLGVACGSTAQDAASGSGLVPEGLYALCREAFMHSETLELEGGRFENWISNDIIREQTDTGSYSVHGDTVLLHLERENFSMEEFRALLADIGFTPDRVDAFVAEGTIFRFGWVRGKPLLWKRGALEAFEETGAASPYRVLVRVDSSWAREGPGPPCAEIGLWEE